MNSGLTNGEVGEAEHYCAGKEVHVEALKFLKSEG